VWQSDDESRFCVCQENSTCLTALPSVKFGGRGIMVWGWFWAWLLSSSKRNSYASAYQHILNNSMVPILWEQFGDCPVPTMTGTESRP